MARWSDVEREAPELAAAARAFLQRAKHKTIATLRRDGSPRISGIEAELVDGDLWFGSMPNALKARDLLRDPRFALHSGSEDPPAWQGDAKLAGRAQEVTDPGRVAAIMRAGWGSEHPSGDMHLFRADIVEVSVVRLGEPADHLVVEVWTPGGGVRQIHR